MDFFKNFYNDDDKIVGLCAFKRRIPNTYTYRTNQAYEFERQFGATRLLYEPKQKTNSFAF